MECIQLDSLEKAVEDDETNLLELAYFYSCTDREHISQKYLERLNAKTDDPEKHALYYMKMGANIERLENYQSAIYFYSQAFSLKPENILTWYLINNNLGYCLNQFGRFAEAEGYCRSAIRIDSQHHNAYKNLGVTLSGLGQYAEAARKFIKALHTEAADPRALRHLEQLFTEHPNVAVEIPDI